MDAGGALDHAGLLGRKILHIFGLQGVDGGRIENRQIGGKAGPD
jgi:hypothetical protein